MHQSVQPIYVESVRCKISYFYLKDSRLWTGIRKRKCLIYICLSFSILNQWPYWVVGVWEIIPRNFYQRTNIFLDSLILWSFYGKLLHSIIVETSWDDLIISCGVVIFFGVMVPTAQVLGCGFFGVTHFLVCS